MGLPFWLPLKPRRLNRSVERNKRRSRSPNCDRASGAHSTQAALSTKTLHSKRHGCILDWQACYLERYAHGANTSRKTLRASIVAPSPNMAFARYGICARSKTLPRRTPWRSPRRCARMAAWKDGGLPSGSRRFAVPIGKFQSDVLRRSRRSAAPTAILPVVSPSTAKARVSPATSTFFTIPKPGLRAPPRPTRRR